MRKISLHQTSTIISATTPTWKKYMAIYIRNNPLKYYHLSNYTLNSIRSLKKFRDWFASIRGGASSS
jgi:hypothetical protein